MLKDKILDLWHINCKPKGDNASRYSCMSDIRNELIKSHVGLIKGMNSKDLWMAIDDATSPLK